MADQFTQRYLAFLGLDAPTPDFETLCAIMSAQRRVVFENLTSLARYGANHAAGRMPPLETDAVLSNWERGVGGGVCYEIASTLGRLLQGLGYDIDPILAQVLFPGSHQAIVVRLDGARYLVDCGNGAPLFCPIPIGDAVELSNSGLRYRYRLADGAPGVLMQDRWVKDEWSPFITYTLTPSAPEAREAGYQRHHVPDGSSFVLSAVRLVRCEDNRVVQLLNHEMTTYTDEGKSVEEIYGLQRYREVVADLFRLPNAPVEHAVSTWARINGTSI